MTRQDFIAGKEFKVDSRTFFQLSQDQRTIEMIYRTSNLDKIVMIDYHMNITKIGRLGFETYTYLLGKKIARKIKFAELELFQG